MSGLKTAHDDMLTEALANPEDYIPPASASVSGILTTGAQTIAGDKNLTGDLTVDTINESTTDNGVVIEGVTLKDGDLNLTTGNTVKINGTDVLSSTALGSGVTSSSLTSVGTLTNLSVTNTISGSINGNASTATTATNLSGGTANIGSGQVYKINNVDVLKASTIGKIRFRASRISSYITIPAGGALTTLIFNTDATTWPSLEDSNNAYNTGTGYFTAPESGVYFFTFSGRLKGSTGNDLIIGFLKNSDPERYYGFSMVTLAGSYDGVTITDYIRLNANDTIRVVGSSASGVSVDYDNSYMLSMFSGVKVGEL